MEMSFFALPSQQGPVQGRFKPVHDSPELVAGLPISLSTKVAACVRRFETPTALNHGRAEPKKDISMLFCIANFSGALIVKPGSRSPFSMQPQQVNPLGGEQLPFSAIISPRELFKEHSPEAYTPAVGNTQSEVLIEHGFKDLPLIAIPNEAAVFHGFSHRFQHGSDEQGFKLRAGPL